MIHEEKEKDKERNHELKMAKLNASTPSISTSDVLHKKFILLAFNPKQRKNGPISSSF